jgi:hypothetical protein
MSDPDRLVESSESEVERLLLRAGREPASSTARQRALLAATGVVAASTLTAEGTAAATAAGKAAAGAKAASLASLKWIVIVGATSLGAVAGTVAVHVAREGAAVHVAPPSANAENGPSRPGAPSSGIDSPPGLPVVAAPSALGTPPAIDTAIDTVPSSPSHSVAPPAPVIAPIAVTQGARSVDVEPSVGSSATAEVARLDEARAALAQGDPARALSTLEGYARRFPRGVLGPEAAVLRIEALVAAGDRPAATRAAQSFLKANPASPYAQRIESLLVAPNP